MKSYEIHSLTSCITLDSSNNYKVAQKMNRDNYSKIILFITYKIATTLNNQKLIKISLKDEWLNPNDLKFMYEAVTTFHEIHEQICEIHNKGYKEYDDKNSFTKKLLNNITESFSKLSKYPDSVENRNTEEQNIIDLEIPLEFGTNFITYLMSYLNLKSVDNPELQVKCKELAHFIFQNYSENYLIPATKEWFKQAKNNDNYKQIKEQVLKFWGAQRTLISKLSCDESDAFGKFSNNGTPMEDLIGSKPTALWYGWFKILNNKVQEQYLYENSEKSEQIDEIKSFNTDLSLKSFGEYDGIGTWSLKPKYYSGFIKAFERPAAEYCFYYNEEKFKKDRILEIKSFKCYHKPSLQTSHDQIIQDIIDIIILDNPSDQELTKGLLSLIHDFSHATVYQRGQAATTKFAVDASALMHNKKVTYSDNWTPPNANYDQQALSIFDKEEFIEYGMNHLHLVDINLVGVDSSENI